MDIKICGLSLEKICFHVSNIIRCLHRNVKFQIGRSLSTCASNAKDPWLHILVLPSPLSDYLKACETTVIQKNPYLILSTFRFWWHRDSHWPPDFLSTASIDRQINRDLLFSQSNWWRQSCESLEVSVIWNTQYVSCKYYSPLCYNVLKTWRISSNVS